MITLTIHQIYNLAEFAGLRVSGLDEDNLTTEILILHGEKDKIHATFSEYQQEGPVIL